MKTNGDSFVKEHEIEWDDEKVARLWDYYSRTPPYSDVYFSKELGFEILRKCELPFSKPLEVLDFGCGPGFIWDHIKEKNIHWNYTGLDFSYDSVEKVKKKSNNQASFRGVYHIRSLPTDLPAAQFDAIFLFEVAEHLNDHYLDATLAESSRLLKPNGILVITTPNEEELFLSNHFCPQCGAIFHKWQHVRSWSTDSLSSYLLRHDFTLHKAKALDFTAINIFNKLKWMIRKIIRDKNVNPHLIAIYKKKYCD